LIEFQVGWWEELALLLVWFLCPCFLPFNFELLGTEQKNFDKKISLIAVKMVGSRSRQAA
jgi:hypothetical protein